MHARWIQLPFDPESGGFDESPLVRALSVRGAAAVREYFFAHEGRPYLGCFVEWDEDEGRFRPLRAASASAGPREEPTEEPADRATEPPGPAARGHSSAARRARRATKATARVPANLPSADSSSAAELELDPEAAATATALRRWRTMRAIELGVPAYRLLTNRQLLALARTRPRTLAALLELPGFGAGRLATWGEELLRLLGDPPALEGPQPAGGSAPPGRDPP